MEELKNDKTLIIVRGLPGSGKSTFAKHIASALGATHYEADMYFYVTSPTGTYDFSLEKRGEAHKWCQMSVDYDMRLDISNIVVSNTFTTESEMEPYVKMAERWGYRVMTLICENRHGGKSIHDVPEETIQKMKNRFKIQL